MSSAYLLAREQVLACIEELCTGLRSVGSLYPGIVTHNMHVMLSEHLLQTAFRQHGIVNMSVA